MALKIETDTEFHLAATYGVGNPKTQYGFIYEKNGYITLHYCKELGCFYAQPDQVLFKLKADDDLDRILNTFKKLDKWYGFDTPVEIIKHEHGPILSITGDHWYFTHKIAYEVLAIMLKESHYRNFRSLKDFAYNNRYVNAGYNKHVTQELIKILQNPIGILKAAEKHKYDFEQMKEFMSGHFSFGLISCIFHGKLDGLTDLPLDS